ncbi:ABC transporter ATP-binding protein [[Clostridium] fimetarium]|uniref:ATP-binding cassette, subfamily B, MsbA/ATP-binding cassette, subfamily B, AbcA/BmrA n=1 Tax=[Clostridium] fimetarium TaxID=99656 RepID=A0A1I0RSZ4_9FIRM|nr:ABC transporter ATP-binding protein [[Clostridium] fimetarium]SEW44445.1 ATP-binding cassette, subfamily B, MsbA/ATP-binding cassette, subfamily B, AbcA/BmrA [[Clostridium] fimetarium]
MLSIWKLSRKKYLVAVQIIMNIGIVLISIWVSDFAKNVVDIGLEISDISKTLMVILGITCVGMLMNYIGVYARSIYSINLVEKMRGMLVSKMLNCKYSYFENEHSGTIKNKMNYDMGNVASYMSGSFPAFISSMIMFTLSFAYLLTVNLSMTLVCSICVPAAFFLTKKVAAPTYKTMEKFENKMDEVSEIGQDSVTGIKVEKAYNLYKVRNEYFKKNMDEATECYREYERRVINAGPYKYLIKAAPTFICIIVGFINAYFGKMTSGEFIAFILLMRNVSNPLSTLPQYMIELKEATVSMNRVLELFQYEDEQFGTGVADETSKDVFDETSKDVFELEDVCFSYSDEGKAVLENLNLSIERGKTVAIAGPSGNGKSTLFKLMLGFHVPNAGKVKLYGMDLQDWNIEAAREKISYVSQETYLFNGSVAENIGYGKPDATFEEIVQASQKAFAYDFIMEMPEGFQTQLSEWGGNLSGGQRQRISIARAFLKDAPIFILDEMTSALDVESEKSIQRAIEDYSKSKTVIIIAHRLSTIVNADKIVVLNEGKVAETGNHKQLISGAGLYAKLYKNQEVSCDSII